MYTRDKLPASLSLQREGGTQLVHELLKPHNIVALCGAILHELPAGG
jgi:hypothetical protein